MCNSATVGPIYLKKRWAAGQAAVRPLSVLMLLLICSTFLRLKMVIYIIRCYSPGDFLQLEVHV